MLRIKRVTIKGFKTFANQTEFVFESGVTAIVGPNGSGKSNVADAIRWCLGEQSFGLLRSKKTVDIIFSGSDKRARLGMAMVSLVLDNSEGELLIDFSEVEITRRAYRDGDNEYLINGQRVQLQTITQLLAPSGLGKRTYAVIGQGLIDSVLSLKPEERRTLFEEAAGITGYQQKRAASLRRLEATQQNLERVHDILAELSPQLRNLKRQADRALERQRVEADLKDLLQTWYGYQWRRTLDELREARAKARQDERAAQARGGRLAAIRETIDSVRGRQTTLRAKLHQQNLLIGDHQRQAEGVGRRLAVTQERHRQTAARLEEWKWEFSELQEEREAVEARLMILRAEMEEAQLRQIASRTAVERLQGRLAERRREQVDYQRRWREAQAALGGVEKLLAERHSRLEQLGERRDTLMRTMARLQEQIRECRRTADHAAAALSLAEANSADFETQLQETQARFATHSQEIGALGRSLRKEEEVRQQAERNVVRIQTRLDLLRRLSNEGAGYASGVRAVLQAAQNGELDGILGTVASQLRVPARLERALEVALGGALQNVITGRWQDTQAAIEHLKRGAGGRATFLPLDRLRSGGPIPAPKLAGIQGNASELVGYDPSVASAIKHLLQRVWIADDLTAARQALDAHRGTGGTARPTVVTLEGEIIRPGGAVTGGNDGRQERSSILGRERGARELPVELAGATEEVQAAVDKAAVSQRRIEAQRQEQNSLEEQMGTLLQQAGEGQQRLEQARLAAAGARQAAEWQAQLLEHSRQELAGLKPQEVLLQKEVEEANVSREAALERAGLAEQAAAQAGLDDLLGRLADLRATAVAAEGELNSRQALLAEQKRSQQQLDSQIQSRTQRLQNLRREEERLLSEIEEISQSERALRERMSDVQLEIEPSETELRRLEKEQARAEAEERAIQQLLRQEESSWNASQLALQRTEDRLAGLRREIGQDFGLAELEEADATAYQRPLGLEALVAQLPVVERLPPGLEDGVRKTRARLRRLSNVNTEAPQEYEQAAERHHFLQTQSDDLEKAANDLGRVMRELDVGMERDLRRTFDAVSTEFIYFFKLLLRGGTAKLSITEPDNILNTGIEIVARPPGKRPQSLDLLSGGERSLTACALVLAMLRVSPTPFCVFDEVDATLDEANVDRLQAALEILSCRTQFIVITHNRRTLEGANSIYGITMGDDGISRVISLRLEDDRMVEANGAAGERTNAVAL